MLDTLWQRHSGTLAEHASLQAASQWISAALSSPVILTVHIILFRLLYVVCACLLVAHHILITSQTTLPIQAEVTDY